MCSVRSAIFEYNIARQTRKYFYLFTFGAYVCAKIEACARLLQPSASAGAACARAFARTIIYQDHSGGRRTRA